jgi:GINS complex protein
LKIVSTYYLVSSLTAPKLLLVGTRPTCNWETWSADHRQPRFISRQLYFCFLMRHLNIDLILSEDERIPCKFLVEGKNLGHLDSSNMENDLADGARVELPLWLAKSLSELKMVELELPKHYGSKMRDAIMAGAAPINLKDFSHYYFDVGLQLSKIKQDLDLQRSLRAAFSGDRFRNLLLFTLSK